MNQFYYALIPGGTSLVTGILVMPVIILFCKRYKLFDPVNARKIHSGSIPRLGGIGIVAAFGAGLFVYALMPTPRPLRVLLPVAGGALIVFIFGFLDDLFDLPARLKFVVQLGAAGLVVAGGFRFDFVLSFELPVWFSVVFSLFWIVGLVNAYNMIDGLDALCGGLSFLTLITLGGIFIVFNARTAVLCFILAAAVAAFLLYNRPPARIFMGDGGSQFLGFVIATAPLTCARPALEYNKLPVMLLLVSLPMLDTIASIWRRLRERRSIMSPDRAHLHHKLLNLGYSTGTAVAVLLLIQCMLCLTVCLALYLGTFEGMVLMAVVYAFMILFFGVIHYTNRMVLRRNIACNEPQKHDTVEI